MTEAARAVGMSVASAYRLRQRGDAAAFARAWQHALDQAIARLADAALSRALHGVATPVFYKGEQIGERRKYDEGLTRFLLRCRAPADYKPLPDHFVVTMSEDPGVTFDNAKDCMLNPDRPLPRLDPEGDAAAADAAEVDRERDSGADGS